MKCGFVLAPRMFRSLCKIAGFVYVPTVTAQMTIGKWFIASGQTHTAVLQRVQCLRDGIRTQ